MIVRTLFVFLIGLQASLAQAKSCNEVYFDRKAHLTKLWQKLVLTPPELEMSLHARAELLDYYYQKLNSQTTDPSRMSESLAQLDAKMEVLRDPLFIKFELIKVYRTDHPLLYRQELHRIELRIRQAMLQISHWLRARH